MTRKILVTSALPYANGSIHIGHLVEYIQTDIWVRFQRLMGNDVTYVCGDDAHGTPIMIKAKQLGTDSKSLITRMNQEHKNDFARFAVVFENFYTTDSPENQALTEIFFNGLKSKGHIARREVEQLFDPVENIFLADRFIKGTCPNCQSPDQYGDGCEVCGKTYDPTDLINPKSIFSGATPVLKKTEHLFLRLNDFREQLKKVLGSGFVDESMNKKLLEWFTRDEETETGGKKTKTRVDAPLRDWDFTRDDPFWGFAIPGENGKRFYNWFDAPIGYIASLSNKLGLSPAEVREYWNDPSLEIYHFIGKDIPYFHGIFWPCMLIGAEYRIPTALRVHGFLTVNGEKMSKSRGTFINAGVFAKHLDPQYLRYYFAAKLGPGADDLDLSFEDLKAKIDGELVNKLANLFSRGKLLENLDNQLGVSANDAVPLLADIRNAADEIAAAYESRNFAAATRLICGLADKANKYIEDQAPWKVRKTDPEAARGILTAGLEAGRILTIYLKAILPEFAAKVEAFLAIPPLEWDHLQEAMEPHKIATYQYLAERLDAKKVEAMIEESKETLGQKSVASSQKPVEVAASAAAVPALAAMPASAAPATAPAGAPAGAKPAPVLHTDDEPLAPIINFDQFLTVDLRVGRVLTVEVLEKSDKLLKITLDAGHLGQRTVLAGIKKAYTPDRLVGRRVIFCANLAPRTMGKFGTSEGMICAAGPGPVEVYVLSPDAGAKPGQRIH